MHFETNPVAVLHNVSIQLLIDMGDELNRTRVIFRLISDFLFVSTLQNSVTSTFYQHLKKIR